MALHVEALAPWHGGPYDTGELGTGKVGGSSRHRGMDVQKGKADQDRIHD